MRNKDNNTYIFCSKKSKLMLVTMATPISSHVKDKNSIFTVRDEDMIFSKRKNPGISLVSI